MAKTVVLLGAGASKASSFHLPTMAGFFGEPTNDLPDTLRELLKWFHPHKTPLQYNLEEILSYLFTCRLREPLLLRHSDATIPRLRLSFHDLVDFVRRRLQIDSSAVCDLQVELFESLSPQDTILTLNYDLVSDQSLKQVERKPDTKIPENITHLRPASRMYKLRNIIGLPDFAWGDPPALVQHERETGFYIKLHGSLDWIWCPNERCPNSRRFYCLGLELSTSGQGVNNPCRLCGSILQAFLVPPVATKHIEAEGKLAFLWSLALQELVVATKLLIFGISFAPSDQELRWLIRQSNEMRQEPAEIVIINPAQTDREIARDLFPKEYKTTEFDDLFEYIKGIKTELVADHP